MKNRLFKKRSEIALRCAVMDDFDSIRALYDGYTGENMRETVILDKGIVNTSLARMISQKEVIVGEVKGEIFGFISGYFVECHFSDDTIFMTMFFYVKPEHRNLSGGFLGLIAELLAQNTKCTKFVVSSPAFEDSEKYDRFYEMSGFKLLEKHYYKNITRKPPFLFTKGH